MVIFHRLARFFTFPCLLVLLLLFQAVFLFQLAVIWDLQGKLRQRRAELQISQEVQEEEIVTPGMIRGL